LGKTDGSPRLRVKQWTAAETEEEEEAASCLLLADFKFRITIAAVVMACMAPANQVVAAAEQAREGVGSVWEN